MDMMTIMMGRMLQADPGAKVVAGGGGALPGQAGELPGGVSPFFQLLGVSIQSRQPQPVSTGDMADPAEMMKSLMETGSTLQPEKAAGERPAVSIMNLLNGLRDVASERRTGEGATSELQSRLASLVAALQEFTDQNGQNGDMTSGLQEQLRGVLNPGVRNREELVAKLVAELEGDSSGEQNASEAISALTASLNGLLHQAPAPKEPKASEVKSDSAMLPTGLTPLEMSLRAEPEKPFAVDPKHQQKLDAEVARAALNNMPGNTETSIAGSVAKRQPVEANVKGVNHEPRSKGGEQLKGANPAALIDIQIRDEVSQPANPEASEAAPAVLAAGDEPVTRESSAGEIQKNPELVPIHKSESFRADMLVSAQTDTKTQPGSNLQPAPADAGVTVSHEEILAQVKERLAERRITPDNGQVTFRLHPAELGELKITVRMEDLKVRVDVVAENRMVKDALLQNVDSLKEALARQNVAMERFDVSTGGRQLFDQGFREGRQQDQQFASRGSAWLTGRHAVQAEAGAPEWQARENALLDMMM